MRFTIAAVLAAAASAADNSVCTAFKTGTKLIYACTGTDSTWACSCTGAPAGACDSLAAGTQARTEAETSVSAGGTAWVAATCGTATGAGGEGTTDATTNTDSDADGASSVVAGAAFVTAVAALAF